VPEAPRWLRPSSSVASRDPTISGPSSGRKIAAAVPVESSRPEIILYLMDKSKRHQEVSMSQKRMVMTGREAFEAEVETWIAGETPSNTSILQFY
jgi:hypothetical protein